MKAGRPLARVIAVCLHIIAAALISRILSSFFSSSALAPVSVTMTGRTRNHLKGSSENIAKRKRVSRKSVGGKQELDLPTELLELILSKLNSRDKARSSAVCRKWKAVAKSLEKVNSPLVLMHIPPGDYNGCYIRDLANWTTVRVPKRPCGMIWHARDGWMLFFDHYTQQMTFFQPETGDLVKLPKLQFEFHGDRREELHGAAFSAPPTSPSCVIFTLQCYYSTGKVDILTCRPGDTLWTTATYQSNHVFLGCRWNCAVVRNGVFYCFDVIGHIGVYDPARTTWTVVPVERLKYTKYVYWEDCEKQFFMAEHNGDIFLVRTWRVVRPLVYKLDEINNKWVKVKHFCGATFFASLTNSLMRDDLPIPMRDCIYFPMAVYSEKRCVTYSLTHKKYYTESQDFDPGALERYEDIWIDHKSNI